MTRFMMWPQKTRYDIDRIAAAFGVTFEQVAHRSTTLQASGKQGIPFFLIRLDRAGNITKRVNPNKRGFGRFWRTLFRVEHS